MEIKDRPRRCPNCSGKVSLSPHNEDYCKTASLLNQYIVVCKRCGILFDATIVFKKLVGESDEIKSI